MKTFKTENYLGFEINYEVNDDGTFYGYCDGIGNSYLSNKNGYPNTFKEAQQLMYEQIEEFINTIPENYEELAKEITNHLVWTGYEDCHVDETTLKTLIENFIEYKRQ